MKSVRVFLIAAVAVVTLGARTAGAQEGEEEKKNWSLTTELSAVQTVGNSESSTFGLAASLRRLWERSEAKFDAGGIRAESVLKTRRAVGTSVTSFVLQEDEKRDKTAENYFARGRYDHKVTGRFAAFAGVDWLRNVFAGIDSRFLVAAGAANKWRDDDRMRFTTDYSVTYTFQEDVVDNPFTKKDFPGARFSYDYWNQITETTKFTSTLIVDWNLDNTDDVRADFINTLPVSINSRLSLKASLQLLWRNDPALTEVGLFDLSGTNTGQKVLVPLEELDTIFTLALVIDM